MPIRRRTIIMMTVPTNTPLQQQIDEFIAEGASWLPTNLLQDLLSLIARLWSGVCGEIATREAPLAAHAGKGSLPGGDFTADAGPQPRDGRKAGADLCALERYGQPGGAPVWTRLHH